MSSRYQTNQTIGQLSVSQHQELRRQEIDILNRLFEQRGSDQYQTVNELLYQDINNRNLVNRMIGQMDEQQLIEQIEQLNRINYYDDHSSQIVRRLLDQHNVQLEQINSPILRHMIEQQLYQSKNEQYTQPQMRQTNMEHRQGDLLQEETYVEQTQQMSGSQHQTDYINTTQQHQEHTEVHNRYQQTVEGIRETIARTAARAQEEHAEGAQPPDVNVTEQLSQIQLQTELSEQNVYADHSIHEQTQNIDQRDLSSVEQELSRINRDDADRYPIFDLAGHRRSVVSDDVWQARLVLSGYPCIQPAVRHGYPHYIRGAGCCAGDDLCHVPVCIERADPGTECTGKGRGRSGCTHGRRWMDHFQADHTSADEVGVNLWNDLMYRAGARRVRSSQCALQDERGDLHTAA